MNTFLLPYRFKWIGTFLVLAGSVGLICYLWFNFILMLPVFAILSSFLEMKYFTIITTNVADELIMISLLTGFFFIAWSKEKTETEGLSRIRSIALSKAVLSNTVFLLFSILFIYGNGFVAVIFLNLISPFIFYLGFFLYLKRNL